MDAGLIFKEKVERKNLLQNMLIARYPNVGDVNLIVSCETSWNGRY